LGSTKTFTSGPLKGRDAGEVFCPSKKVGCPWRIVINKQAKSIVWKVTTVILEHQNHEEIQPATKITPEIQDQIKGLKSHRLQSKVFCKIKGLTSQATKSLMPPEKKM